ncbi:hypothetical protein XENOCAPTIV_001002 [Xenoophorus captivus]|uniref:CO dehydrogenase flavoprotein C-terminal domain-containing protein n=1 Tax=Xenoophorus captivus TaxID=1517983 RepID=A0ABV0Q794_9TELE
MAETQNRTGSDELIFFVNGRKNLSKCQRSSRSLCFHGERTTWLQPESLEEFLLLKWKHPDARVVVGNTEVGESAAVGGNIMTASPISDLNPVFMAADSFKQSPRREDDISIVTAAMSVIFYPGTDIVKDLRLSYGGMAPVTVLATKTANRLLGRQWGEQLLQVACSSLAEEMSLDPSAPGGMVMYRRTLTLSLFYKFYLTVLQKLRLQVTCVGHIIGAMVADTQLHAQRAAKAVKIQYEELKPVVTIQEHFYLETNVTLAVPRGEDGEMELFISSQSPSDSQIMERALFHMENSYCIPNVRGQGFLCRTNLPSNTAFRGFGGPQGMMVAENWITDVAHSLGCSAEEVRRLNLYSEGESTPYNQVLHGLTLDRCWDECLSRSEYEQRRAAANLFNRDGSVLLTHGGTEMGQGLHTKMVQVASRVLGIPCSKIYISETSTNTVANTSPTAASASSDLNGAAVHNACETLLKRLERYKTKDPEGSWEDWVEGGFMQGLGLFTLEELHYSPQGVLLTRGPGSYKIPAFGDIPTQLTVSLLRDAPNDKAIFASKAVGEPPLFLASSVFYAIKDAIRAARAESGMTGPFRLDSPASAERIRNACCDQFTKLVQEAFIFYQKPL